jgi:glycerol-3-phosphate dehydrogenase
VLHSGARYAVSDPRDAAECIAENRTLREIAPDCVEATGGVFVQLAGDDPAYYDRKLEACREVGIEAEPLSDEALSAAIPGDTDHIQRGFRVPDGIVWPSRLIVANALDAMSQGAEVYTNAPVEGMTVTDGCVASVDVGGALDETVVADHVVNATGAWAEGLGELAGLDISMNPTRGVMIAVEQEGLDVVVNRCRDPDDGDILVPHGEEVVLGTTSVAVDDPEAFETADWESERVIEEGDALMPGLAEAQIDRTWWGVRPLYVPDEARDGGRGISRGFSIVDHEVDGVANMHSVLGGKVTTYRLMAEHASDAVCERLGVDADCATAERPLAAGYDVEELEAAIDRFDAVNPTSDTISPRELSPS